MRCCTGTPGGCGTSQPTGPESGQRQPSLPALARLIDAADFELMLGLRRQSGRLRLLSGPMDRQVRSAALDADLIVELAPHAA
jgi:hypothetical protein